MGAQVGFLGLAKLDFSSRDKCNCCFLQIANNVNVIQPVKKSVFNADRNDIIIIGSRRIAIQSLPPIKTDVNGIRIVGTSSDQSQ